MASWQAAKIKVWLTLKFLTIFEMYYYSLVKNKYTFILQIHVHITVGKKIIWSPADFVRLPTDKEMISL